jgi:hypothetical protein
MQRSLLLLFVTMPLAWAQAPHPSAEEQSHLFYEHLAATNPTYSPAIAVNRSPDDRLTDFRSRFDTANSDYAKGYLLAEIAKAALEDDQNIDADDYANRALTFAQEHRITEQAAGRIDYYANFVLGRLALLKGDTKRAEGYLLRSGQTKGDAVLRTFGPNMSLARELLKHPDADAQRTVVQFLEDCKRFWMRDCENGKLDRWQAMVLAGKMPDFDMQLFQ